MALVEKVGCSKSVVSASTRVVGSLNVTSGAASVLTVNVRLIIDVRVTGSSVTVQVIAYVFPAIRLVEAMV